MTAVRAVSKNTTTSTRTRGMNCAATTAELQKLFQHHGGYEERCAADQKGRNPGAGAVSQKDQKGDGQADGKNQGKNHTRHAGDGNRR